MRTATDSWSLLKSWSIKLTQRTGFDKAIMDVARKPAIVLYRIWLDGTAITFKNEAMAA